ncbi:hypothetical protein K7B07_21675 [Niabella sp. 3A5MI-3]|nr:DUF6624 domain-containing protein [Niabella beijingensis]MBZ4191539.1 hypothetical protein [Niabella beijingensis]
MKDNKLEPRYLGYFTDRISTDKGEKQKYGTQLMVTMDNRTIMYPLIDPYRTDTWRKEIGLPPLAKYLKESQNMEWTLKEYFRHLPEAEKVLKKKKEILNRKQSDR